MNDHVLRSMSFIFEADHKNLKNDLIDLLQKHTHLGQGGARLDIMLIALKYGNSVWTHPDRGKVVRGGPTLTTVTVLPEYEQLAQNYQSDLQMLTKDSQRAQKTLNQLVRGTQSDQDLRDSLPEILAEKLGLAHMPRTREPGYRYETLEPRVYENIKRDLDMIEGYFNARTFL